jgi:hypothetical protein
MTEYHNIKIKLKPYSDGITLGTVELDGRVVHGVRNIKVESDYKRVTEVTLTLIAGFEAEIEGAAAFVDHVLP